ncbi:TRAFs-binding domain-containing protein [Cryptosporangium arvum]|uniref:TRAFs-binding domain-containing protein n=1 Tax=Cryptosporangium arvum TaxID=80871 RepID=UPI0004BB72CA|nr:TRAFs-binding domain-containing protein [Cryptosporangium arvum]
MIVVFGGRRTSGDRGDFPVAHVDYVEERVRRLLTGLQPAHLIGSAAAGSDLIFLRAALELGIPATVVLAGDQSTFAEKSVADQPGWKSVFDRILASRRITVQETDPARSDDETYRAVNTQIVTTALAMKDSQAGTQILGVLVSAGGTNHTEDLAEELRGNSIDVLRVDPSIDRNDTPLAFVAMPFGNKLDPDRPHENYQSNATWERLLFPALTDAGYRAVRADSNPQPAVIDAQMIRDLLRADLVVADLATLNPNVLWELGVRHTAQRRGTMVIHSRYAPIPFDLKGISIRLYERAMEAITDRQVLDGLREFRQALTAIAEHRSDLAHTDSPVHSTVPTLRVTGLPAADSRNVDLTEMVNVAHDLSDIPGLVRAAEAAKNADIAQHNRAALQLKAAVLIEKARPAAALTILEPLAIDDKHHDNERLQQTYVHALVRAERRPEDLEAAGERLADLNRRHPGSAETLGLIGSVAKVRATQHLGTGRNALRELRRAANAYQQGFLLVPTDYYPGVNAVTLLRVLAGHAVHSETADRDRTATLRLLPVVRFMAERASATDIWAQATLAELALQEHLLGNLPLGRATDLYASAAAEATEQQRTSMARQLQMLLAWGDQAEVINPLLEVIT